MQLTELIALVLAILTTVAGLTALITVGAALLPALVERARANVERLPVRSFLVGLVNALFFGLISLALLSAGEGPSLLGLIVGSVLLLYIALGLAAVADLLADRLGLHELPPLRRRILGALALQLAALTPIVGWVMVPTLAGLTGYGAIVIAIVQRRGGGNP